jgi:hypothetical protein
MKIFITPEDIMKRCLWDSYVYYIVGSDKEGEKLLKENKEFELSERDAIVIGLLKVIETDNLVHRFNDYITHFLTVRSLKEKENLWIRKKAIETAIDKFYEKFPDYWKPTRAWELAISEMNDYIKKLRSNLEKLEITKLTIQNVSYDFYNANAVKKFLVNNVF